MKRRVSNLIKAALFLALVFFAVYGLRNLFLSGEEFLSQPKVTSTLGVPQRGIAPAPLENYGLGNAQAPAVTTDKSMVAEVPAAGGSISERLVVKTGNLVILVKDTLAAVEGVRKLAEGMGGFVLSSRTWYADAEEQRVAGEVVVKVPAERFEEAMGRIKELALKVTSEQSAGRDVTEEYTDLQSQLKNLEVAEAQLQELMKRAGSVSDILEVQRELTRTEGQIEQTKGRIKYLEETTAMSTITVSVATEEEELPIVEEKWRPLATVKAALRTLVNFWQSMADRLIYLGIFLAPWLVVGLVGWRVWRGSRKNRES